MSVIQASSAGVKDMADGSLRITLEFDPRHAKEAYSLFGARGTPCAVAALTKEATTTAARQETMKQETKEKPGDLCIMACSFCADPLFWQWINERHEFACKEEADASRFIRELLSIDSRRKIDQFSSAANAFHNQIRKPFLDYKASLNRPRAA